MRKLFRTLNQFKVRDLYRTLPSVFGIGFVGTGMWLGWGDKISIQNLRGEIVRKDVYVEH
jgi:hypothetical protein